MDKQEILSQLTLLEKAAMISGKTVWESRDVKRLGISSVFFADGPSGVRKQAGASDHLGLNPSLKSTCFPSGATLANSWSEEIVTEVATAIGAEASAQDVDVLLGPGLNIKRSPLCGRNFEYYAEDPYLAGKMAAAFIRGVQSQNVAATPKHFAVNSQELRRMASDSVVDDRALHEIYLTAFEIAVQEGNPKGLMTSYNLVDDTYANENKYLLQDVLRDRWGYQGFVVTDWGGSNSIVEGVKAGSNFEMPAPGLDSARQLVQAVKEGRLSEEDIDHRILEILTFLEWNKNRVSTGEINWEEHHNVARKAAEESIVLLKNEDRILPLSNPQQKVAILGEMAEKPRYQGAGSSLINTNNLENALDCVKSSNLNFIGYEPGYSLQNEGEGLEEKALALAKQADVVVIYLGLTTQDETEGLDRQHLNIPQNQVQLLQKVSTVNPNIVLILCGGAPIEMPWHVFAKGILHGYLGGEAAASAMLHVLTGKVNPSGKLNETYPLSLLDTPCHSYYPATEKTAEYRESIYVGYRYYDTFQKEVQYPFGYGKSYTQFTYSNLKVTDKGVEFQLTNTGELAGAEVAQLYVGLSSSQLLRPDLELKGFAKVFLEPQETKTVVIPFHDKTFRVYNAKAGEWQIESGNYRICIGENSRSILLESSIERKGELTELPYTKESLPSYSDGLVDSIPQEEFERLVGHSVEKPPQGRELQINDTLGQMLYAKSGLARMVARFMKNSIEKGEKKGTPDLNSIFTFNMPFRAIAKMTNGMVSMQMVDSILVLVNGRFFAGLGGIIKGFFANRKANKLTQQELDEMR